MGGLGGGGMNVITMTVGFNQLNDLIENRPCQWMKKTFLIFLDTQLLQNNIYREGQ